MSAVDMSPPTDNNVTELGADRRQRFRIEDTAILEISLVSTEAMESTSAENFFSRSCGFTLMRELQDIERDSQPLLRGISERDSELAAYLSAINKKIETIGTAVAENILPEDQQLQAIDLSEGGIGFSHSEKLLENKPYAAKIWFHKPLIGVSVFFQVVACNRAIDGGYRISAAFHNLPESERKIIVKHIMRVQAAQQRSKKAQVTDLDPTNR